MGRATSPPPVHDPLLGASVQQAVESTQKPLHYSNRIVLAMDCALASAN
jgi:hypothetical protein